MKRAHWQPPETERERELRTAYVSPKRARMIRAEVAVDQRAEKIPGNIPAAEVRPCGLPVDARCYLPAARCCQN